MVPFSSQFLICIAVPCSRGLDGDWYGWEGETCEWQDGEYCAPELLQIAATPENVVNFDGSPKITDFVC